MNVPLLILPICVKVKGKEFQHQLEAVHFLFKSYLNFSGHLTGLCVSESSSNHSDPLLQSRHGLQLPTAS